MYLASDTVIANCSAYDIVDFTNPCTSLWVPTTWNITLGAGVTASSALARGLMTIGSGAVVHNFIASETYASCTVAAGGSLAGTNTVDTYYFTVESGGVANSVIFGNPVQSTQMTLSGAVNYLELSGHATCNAYGSDAVISDLIVSAGCSFVGTSGVRVLISTVLPDGYYYNG